MSDEGQKECSEKNPGIDFTAFVLSLSTACLQHLEGQAANLPMAEQTIDILAMLQDKTHGNLSDEEQRLLGTVLYDLRMRYVTRARERC